MAEAKKVQLTVGHVVDGRYYIERVLGSGSFGDVYLVKDQSNGTSFALKMLRAWSMSEEIRDNVVRRFQLEYQIGQIPSAFLVQSRSYGEVEGNPYILMEYCPAGDLLRQSNNDYNSINFSLVAINVLYGLMALHESGRVHRDLKPENVLIKPNGTYALSDFGIAGDRNHQLTKRNWLGKPNQIFGTYAYMPPEQAKPEGQATVLPTTDIFSFGVMMYKLLTRQLPFGPLKSTEDLVEYQERGRKGQWNRSLLESMPNGSAWKPLIEACLQPKYKNRVQTAKEVLKMVPRAKVVEERHDSSDWTATVLDGATIIDTERTKPAFQKKIVRGVLLRETEGEEAGKVYYLDDMLEKLGGKRLRLTLGRIDNGVRNDINILETRTTYVSRYHCTFEIDYDRGEWVVRDGQWQPHISSGWKFSTNGTYVNSSEAGRNGLIFRPGDIISVGDVKFRAEGY
ncbi:MAG: protein kinase [Muribaculaceae bacterium]